MKFYTTFQKWQLLVTLLYLPLFPVVVYKFLTQGEGIVRWLVYSVPSYVLYPLSAVLISICMAYPVRLWVMGLEQAEDRKSVLWRCLKIDLIVSLPLGLVAIPLALVIAMQKVPYFLYVLVLFVFFPLAKKVYDKMGADAFPEHSKRRVVWQLAAGFFWVVLSTSIMSLVIFGLHLYV